MSVGIGLYHNSAVFRAADTSGSRSKRAGMTQSTGLAEYDKFDKISWIVGTVFNPFYDRYGSLKSTLLTCYPHL